MGAQNEEKMNYRMEYAQGKMMLYNLGIKSAPLIPTASTNAFRSINLFLPYA